jgi:hypothetical protein
MLSRHPVEGPIRLGSREFGTYLGKRNRIAIASGGRKWAHPHPFSQGKLKKSHEKLRQRNATRLERCSGPRRSVFFNVANKPIEAKSIINVATHPTILSIHGILNCLMTFLLVDKSMVTIITGTATTPLMMAAQKSARIGSILMKLSPSPTSVAAARTP